MKMAPFYVISESSVSKRPKITCQVVIALCMRPYLLSRTEKQRAAEACMNSASAVGIA
jgi:hypothetical protein